MFWSTLVGVGRLEALQRRWGAIEIAIGTIGAGFEHNFQSRVLDGLGWVAE